MLGCPKSCALCKKWDDGQQTIDFIEGNKLPANAGRTFLQSEFRFRNRCTRDSNPARVDLPQPANIQVRLKLLNRLARSWGSRLKLVSLNVALPRLATYRTQTFKTGIFKQPISGPVVLRALNLDGDRQADLAVHGGPNKAVYGYPSEHYEFWQEQLGATQLPWGMFGENFSTEGVFENDLHIGDRFSIGTAIIVVRQPRIPCYKLAAKFHRSDILARFLDSGRSGFYFSVEQEGTVEAGNEFTVLSRDPDGITIAEMNRLFAHDMHNRELFEKALQTSALPDDWRDHLKKRFSAIPQQLSS